MRAATATKARALVLESDANNGRRSARFLPQDLAGAWLAKNEASKNLVLALCSQAASQRLGRIMNTHCRTHKKWDACYCVCLASTSRHYLRLNQASTYKFKQEYVQTTCHFQLSPQLSSGSSQRSHGTCIRNQLCRLKYLLYLKITAAGSQVVHLN
jgi:hypothetical protein